MVGSDHRESGHRCDGSLGVLNGTVDADPMHIHEVVFSWSTGSHLRRRRQQDLSDRSRIQCPLPPEPWETGYKDTVIALPGQVTRVRAKFSTPGQFVWHCHIVEHEDNEMMRPYFIDHDRQLPADARD